DEIRALLDEPSADVLGHLRRQHGLLLEQAERLQRTIKAVEELMNARRKGVQLTAEEQVEIFGTSAFGEEYAARPENVGARRTRGSNHCSGFRSSAGRTGLRSRPRARRCSRRWRRPSAVVSSPDPLRRTSSRPGTARRSSGP